MYHGYHAVLTEAIWIRISQQEARSGTDTDFATGSQKRHGYGFRNRKPEAARIWISQQKAAGCTVADKAETDDETEQWRGRE
ncbi:MAG: hypothetical protein HFI60_03355 [Lachnospiraceae bacterium]|nr:hypothetical protein [Lachnospiraceae bacterium]